VTRGKWVFPICQIGHGKSGSGRAHQVDGLNGSVDCLVFRDVLDRTIVQLHGYYDPLQHGPGN